MKLTIGRPVEITLDIHLRPDHRGSGGLEVYVDDWPWDGPLRTIESALERLHHTEQTFRERAAQLESYNVINPSRTSPTWTWDLAIYQRLNGERAHYPEN